MHIPNLALNINTIEQTIKNLHLHSSGLTGPPQKHDECTSGLRVWLIKRFHYVKILKISRIVSSIQLHFLIESVKVLSHSGHFEVEGLS